MAGVLPPLFPLRVTGLIVRNLFGRQIVGGFEDLVRRIPVLGSVYGSKTFSETVLTDKGTSFKRR